MVATMVCVGAVFATSLLYSVNLWHIDLDYGEIACMIDTLGSCSNCDEYDEDKVIIFLVKGDTYEREQCPPQTPPAPSPAAPSYTSTPLNVFS